MKKIKVIVREKTLLELKEDASKGDLIDLKELIEVDTSLIESIIDSNKDKIYLSKLEAQQKVWNLEKEKELDKLQHENLTLRKEYENRIILKEKEVDSKYQEQVMTLKNEIINLEKEKKTAEEKINKDNDIKLANYKLAQGQKYSELESKYNNLHDLLESKIKEKENELEKKYSEEISNLKKEYALLMLEKDSKEKEIKNTFALEKEREFTTLRENYQKEIDSRQEKIDELKRQKSILNSKQIGEDLESWCDNEVTSYMQNGLQNCRWLKDNETVKGEDGKSTKADFIFKIYANSNRKEDELLTSICFDMKDENPDSKTRQTNKSFYQKLNDDRKKKGCKYAVLVSNLETDKTNALPIYKVNDYEDMYVVRPAYLMTFINMIVSLTLKYGDLLIKKEKETIDLKEKLELIDKFNKLKNEYLDKPLNSLDNQISLIIESTSKIRKASEDIDNYCDKIKNNYISKIEKKLKDFELKTEKQVIKNLE